MRPAKLVGPARVSILIRKLDPSDHAQFLGHLSRLDRQNLTLRFGASVSPQFLRGHVGRSLLRYCVIHGYFENGTLRAVAELNTNGDVFTNEAEAALSVEQDWQRHGIGTELLARTLRSARNRGIARLTFICLSWNRPMRALAQHFHAELHFEEGGITGAILPKPPTPFSVFAELWLDFRVFSAGLIWRTRAI